MYNIDLKKPKQELHKEVQIYISSISECNSEKCWYNVLKFVDDST